MIRTRVLKEEKWFSVESTDYYGGGYGESYHNKGIIYCNKPFTSMEECWKEVELAKVRFNEIPYWNRPNEPKLIIYWKLLEENIINE